MIHPQLNHLIAEQHTQDRRRAAERDRVSHSIHTDGRAGTPTRRIARLGATLRLRRSPTEIAC